MLTERTEEFLSYFTGLAPVGSPFAIRTDHAAEDMDVSRWAVWKHMKRLEQAGYLRSVEPMRYGVGHMLVVTRRLEGA